MLAAPAETEAGQSTSVEVEEATVPCLLGFAGEQRAIHWERTVVAAPTSCSVSVVLGVRTVDGAHSRSRWGMEVDQASCKAMEEAWLGSTLSVVVERWMEEVAGMEAVSVRWQATPGLSGKHGVRPVTTASGQEGQGSQRPLQ